MEDVEKYSKRTVRVTKDHNDECKRLLKLMGVPIIEARLWPSCYCMLKDVGWSQPQKPPCNDSAIPTVH